METTKKDVEAQVTYLKDQITTFRDELKRAKKSLKQFSDVPSLRFNLGERKSYSVKIFPEYVAVNSAHWTYDQAREVVDFLSANLK